jgi:hypothetical protein
MDADKPKRVRRPPVRKLPDGTIEELSAAYGRVITVPGDPRPRGIDLDGGAPGWESWAKLRWRLWGG